MIWKMPFSKSESIKSNFEILSFWPKKARIPFCKKKISMTASLVDGGHFLKIIPSFETWWRDASVGGAFRRFYLNIIHRLTEHTWIFVCSPHDKVPNNIVPN